MGGKGSEPKRRWNGSYWSTMHGGLPPPCQVVKDGISFRSFLLLCYSSSMVFLWGFVVFSKSNPLPIHGQDWIYLIGLAAISQVLGHGIYNWCVRLDWCTNGSSFLTWWTARCDFFGVDLFVWKHWNTTTDKDYFAHRFVPSIDPTVTINEIFPNENWWSCSLCRRRIQWFRMLA